MHVRPIAAHEIEAFVGINTNPSQATSIRQYLEQLIAKDVVRIEWCFVVEDSAQFVGRVAFWKLPKNDKPSDIILLDLPWENDNYEAVGRLLLEEVFTNARSLGVEQLEYVLDTPPAAPQWQFFPDQRTQILESLGFELLRETYRFQIDTTDHEVEFPKGLIFRGLPEVGEDTFIDALIQVSDQSLDRRIQHDRAQMGVEKEARLTMEDLRRMDTDLAWWQLAYTPDGALVGLVMPTRTPTFATIGYIGVVPEQRGHGYIHLLLQQGTATLHAVGAHYIRTDTDVNNKPMANSFHRAGYTQFATRREYSVKL